MIARFWHGMTTKEDGEAYLSYLNATGIPDYQNTPGNQGVYLMRRVEADRAHFLIMTLWDSVEAIQAFAGRDYEKARYYPKDEQFLLELEPDVQHYQVEAALPGNRATSS